MKWSGTEEVITAWTRNPSCEQSPVGSNPTHSAKIKIRSRKRMDFFNKECMMNNEFYNASPCKKTIVYSALNTSI